MLNFKKNHIFGLIPATPKFFLWFGLRERVHRMVKFWKELIGAFIGDLDALITIRFFVTLYYSIILLVILSYNCKIVLFSYFILLSG